MTVDCIESDKAVVRVGHVGPVMDAEARRVLELCKGLQVRRVSVIYPLSRIDDIEEFVLAAGAAGAWVDVFSHR